MELLEPRNHKTIIPKWKDVVEWITNNGWRQRSNYHMEGNTVVRNKEEPNEVGETKELYMC